MKKRFPLTIGLLAILRLASAQVALDSVYLRRLPEKGHEFVRIPNTGAYFIQKAALKPDHFGWQEPGDFVSSDSNLLYVEMNSTDVARGPWDDYAAGSFQLVIDLPPGVTALNLDTIGRLGYWLINSYAERGNEKPANNQFSGLLQFDYKTGKKVVIKGVVEIKTTRPYKTRQQVLFGDEAFPVMSLARHDSAEMSKQALRLRREKEIQALAAAKAHEQEVFFDSVFTQDVAKRNSLAGLVNGKRRFTYALSQSYILTGAKLGRRPQGTLMDMLGANFLEVGPGPDMVFMLHTLDDPDQHVVDDETNYSLGIEVGSLAAGKIYFFHHQEKKPVARLGYWQWGPAGQPFVSGKAAGTVTISGNNGSLVSGKLDLTFYFHKSTVRIVGDFVLPTVSLEAVSRFKEMLEQKYGDQ